MDAFIELFDPLSMPLLFLVFGAAGLAFVFVLEFIVHKRMRPDVRERVSESTAVMIQVLAVFYSVLVAFVIVYDVSVLTNDFRVADRNGKPSADTTAKLDSLYRTVEAAEPVVGNSKFYTQTVSDLGDVTKARRGRIADASDTIPGPLFFLVVVVSV